MTFPRRSHGAEFFFVNLHLPSLKLTAKVGKAPANWR